MPERIPDSVYATTLAGAALDGFNSIIINGTVGPIRAVNLVYGQVLSQGIGQGISNQVPLPVEIALAEVAVITTITGLAVATIPGALILAGVGFAASTMVVAGYENFGPFRNALDAQADVVVDIFVEAGEWIGEMHQDLQDFQETLSENYDTAIDQIGDWVENRMSDFQNRMDQLVDGAGNAMGDALLGLRDFLHSVKDITEDIINGDYSGVSEDILDFLDGLFGPLSDGPTPVSDAISDAAQWFRDNFISPLVFDLNGNGLGLTSLEGSAAFFDLDNDQFVEQTGWVQPTDGFLVRDVNNNGVIDNQNEMFGEDSTGGAWDKLALYDTNGNGTIAGAERDALRLWQDANGNGQTDPGELKTLQEAGIARNYRLVSGDATAFPCPPAHFLHKESLILRLYHASEAVC